MQLPNTITSIGEKQDNWLKIVFPSASNPRNIRDAMFMNDAIFIRGKNEIDTTSLIKFEDCHSIVRVYRDIFLTYDREIKSWVLLRIIVP